MTQISLRSLTDVFLKIGLLSFGGPAAQIGLLHRELVETRGWISEKDYLTSLSFCMLLPGPEAMQLATYTGWRLRGVVGGLIAGGLFILPGALVVLALSVVYAYLGSVPLVQALFMGVQAAIVVIVFDALFRMARKALQTPAAWGIAIAAFLGIFTFQLPFPLIILLAALMGAFLFKAEPVEPAPVASIKQTLKTILIWTLIWLLPLAILALQGGILFEIGTFFSQLSILSFGGAYALLAWMADTAVTAKAWLSPDQMIDGLGLAETTPGPLILVTEFVGFQAGYNAGGLGLGLVSACITLWVMFAPSFLFIFAGAPWTLWIASKPRLVTALSGVSAAVTGVILNLTLWFSAHIFFENVEKVEKVSYGPLSLIMPELSSLNWMAALIALFAALLVFRFKLGLPIVLGICAAIGLGTSFIS